MKRKWLLALCCLVVLATVLASCAPAPKPGASQVPEKYRRITLVGTSLGSASTTVMLSLARILIKYYPEIEWSSRSGASTAVNVAYLAKETIQVGTVMASTYIDLYGYDKANESKFRSLIFPLPLSNYPFLIPKDKPWKDITEVPKGTSLRPGTPTSTETVGALAWLNLVGLSKDYFNWLPMGKGEAVDAWRQGKIDIMFANVDGPLPWLMDLATSPRKPKPMGLTPEQVKKANAEKTFEKLGFLPVSKSNLVELVPDVFSEEIFGPKAVILVGVREDFPEDIAYKMAKILDEHHEELVQTFPPAKWASPENHIKNASPPFEIHPGVAKYYREKGYLK